MWWLLLLPISLAGPIEQNLSVGQILNVTLTPRTTVENPMENGLPEWMYVSNGRLVGIPTAKDIGPLTLKVLFLLHRQLTIFLDEKSIKRGTTFKNPSDRG